MLVDEESKFEHCGIPSRRRNLKQGIYGEMHPCLEFHLNQLLSKRKMIHAHHNELIRGNEGRGEMTQTIGAILA